MKRWVPLTAALSLSLTLMACGKDDATPATAEVQTGQVSPSVQMREREALRAMSADELRTALKRASDENRLYAPAGDNVFEYLLALRDKSPGDVAISSQLIDATPMLIAATDQAIKENDAAETDRFLGLLRAADARNPALATLARHRDERRAQLERERIAAVQEQQRIAASQEQQRKASEQAAKMKVDAQSRAATQAPATTVARPAEPTTTATPAATPAKEPEETDRPGQPNLELDLRPISTPDPDYPVTALRNRTSGEVTVEMTIGRDGSVIAARVVRARPRGVFDDAALSTVRRWRYAAVSSPITVRRTFEFSP